MVKEEKGEEENKEGKKPRTVGESKRRPKKREKRRKKTKKGSEGEKKRRERKRERFEYSREIKRKFPHEEYRRHQEEYVDKIGKALEQNDIVILPAPTGFGKSAVNLTFCRNYLSYYVTPQKTLQDQLRDDYGKYMAVLKGMNNYSCEVWDVSCDEAPCQFDICHKHEIRDCEYCDHALGCPCVPPDLKCPYRKALKEALSSQVLQTNFSKLIVDPKLERRELLVIDEAHGLGGYLVEHVKVSFREDEFEYPERESFQEYLDWIVEKREEIEEEIERLEMMIKEVGKGSEEVDERTHGMIKRMKWLKGKDERLDILLEDVLDYGRAEGWVACKEKEYDAEKDEEVEKLVFKPITPYRFIKSKLLPKAEKIILSSATPPRARDLGLRDGKWECKKLESVQSNFPKENRPIILDFQGKMSLGEREETIPKIAREIVEVREGKTLVHCHSYEMAEEISNCLEDHGVDHILQRPWKREEDLGRWKRGDIRIFLSVNMYSGLDLKGSLCRTNILAKVPYPYLGDPRIEKRLKLEGDYFYNREAAVKIQQAYGRAVRSKKDWATFYIMDSCFQRLYNNNEEMFYPWFREAIKGKGRT